MIKLFDEIPCLANDRIIIKRLEPQDAEALGRLVSNYKVYRYEPTFLFELLYEDPRQMIEDVYKDIFLNKESLILGIYLKEGMKFCGLAEYYSYSAKRKKASLGYRLAEEFWGMGLASQVLPMMIDYLFEQTDVETVTASILPDNGTSEHVALKHGLTKYEARVPEDWGYDEPMIVDKWIRRKGDMPQFDNELYKEIAENTKEWAEKNGIKISDDASDFVMVSDVVPDAILEIRYYSTFNFLGQRVDGYEEPIALITKEAAAALKEASDEAVSMGYRLKVYDAYRPQKAVAHFVRWALDTHRVQMREYFYPQLKKEHLFPLGFIAERSGHTRGSTIDLTLFDMKENKELDMGGNFDYFGDLSHPAYLNVTEEQYNNRMLLRDLMVKHGFKPLQEEWWHFTLENEPYTDTYFTFPVNSKSVGK
ncbi:MAG: GNAT family N-acetyltransferase [Lachnospiraceae bacterium]|nr:GNAT family N-acetyltransferase [Lachnospiraceae bacterium]